MFIQLINYSSIIFDLPQIMQAIDENNVELQFIIIAKLVIPNKILPNMNHKRIYFASTEKVLNFGCKVILINYGQVKAHQFI